MLQKIKISPANSLLFIEDIDGGTPPEPVWGARILSTRSCISFACFPEQEGSTEIAIGPQNEIDPGLLLVFDGELETPGRVVVVSALDRERILSAIVDHTKTKVRIWYSHPKWPDKVTIGLD